MATLRFRGDAPRIAQVVTATPAQVEVGDRFTLALNGKQVSFTATAATVANVTAGLAAAVTAAPYPEFAELTATDESTFLSLVARTPGIPFEVTASTANGGAANTQTLTLLTLTPSGGPEHWNDPANWSAGAVPQSGDEVFLENSQVSLRYGLDQSGVVLAGLHVAASYTGEIGLPRWNETGGEPYAEYRPRYLAIGAGNVVIGSGQGSGSSRLQLDTGTQPTHLGVATTGLPWRAETPALLWRGTHATNELNVLAGSVGVACEGGDVATLAYLRASGGEVRCGAGATLGAVACSGQAQLTCEAGLTNLEQSGGEVRVLGEGTLGNAQLTGGRLHYHSTGTLAAITLDGPAAVLDLSGDSRPKTVAACTLRRGAIDDPHGTATWTTGVQLTASAQAG